MRTSKCSARSVHLTFGDNRGRNNVCNWMEERIVLQSRVNVIIAVKLSRVGRGGKKNKNLVGARIKPKRAETAAILIRVARTFGRGVVGEAVDEVAKLGIDLKGYHSS